MRAPDLNVKAQVKRMLVDALTRTHGDRKRAAELLGVSSKTIAGWIEKFDLASLFPPHMNRDTRRMQ